MDASRLFFCGLASRTGIPQSVLRTQWTEDDYHEMKLYQLIRPYGEDYLDLMFTRLQMAVLQAAGAQDLDFDDFLPDWGSWMSKLLPQKPKTTAELMAELKKDKDRVLVINPDMKPKKVTFRPDQIEAMEQLRIAREAGNPVGQN